MTNCVQGFFSRGKKAIEIVASTETYQNLSTFKELKQLNETVRTYKEKFADKLNKTHVAVLNYLQRHSANVGLGTIGVSWKKKNNIAEDLGKSRRTIIRVCNDLEELGIIRQYETKRRSDNYQTSNAIVILPLPEKSEVKEQNVTQENSQKVDISAIQKKEMSHQKNNIYSLKQNIKTYNKRTADAARSIYDNVFNKFLVSKWVPESFRDLMSSYIEFQDAKVIEDFWRSVHILTCKDKTLNRESIIELAEMSFVELTRKMAKGCIKDKPVKYFTGVLKKKISKMIESEIEEAKFSQEALEKMSALPFPTLASFID